MEKFISELGVKIKLQSKKLKTGNLPEQILQEFQNETRIMTAFAFPQIVRLLGVVFEGSYCLVMEFMDNGSLYSFLKTSKPIDWQMKYSFASEIANGLEYLHDHNVLHKDLKSLNVLLDLNFRCKLADFGLSAVKVETQSQTLSKGGPIGTIQWMAPELFTPGNKYSPACDVFSYAMVLFEIATRQTPWKEASPPMLAIWVGTQGLREAIPDTVPVSFKQVVTTCWQQDATKRPTIKEICRNFPSAPQTANKNENTEDAGRRKDVVPETDVQPDVFASVNRYTSNLNTLG